MCLENIIVTKNNWFVKIDVQCNGKTFHRSFPVVLNRSNIKKYLGSLCGDHSVESFDLQSLVNNIDIDVSKCGATVEPICQNIDRTQVSVTFPAISISAYKFGLCVFKVDTPKRTLVTNHISERDFIDKKINSLFTSVSNEIRGVVHSSVKTEKPSQKLSVPLPLPAEISNESESENEESNIVEYDYDLFSKFSFVIDCLGRIKSETVTPDIITPFMLDTYNEVKQVAEKNGLSDTRMCEYIILAAINRLNIAKCDELLEAFKTFIGLMIAKEHIAGAYNALHGNMSDIIDTYDFAPVVAKRVIDKIAEIAK